MRFRNINRSIKNKNLDQQPKHTIGITIFNCKIIEMNILQRLQNKKSFPTSLRDLILLKKVLFLLLGGNINII